LSNGHAPQTWLRFTYVFAAMIKGDSFINANLQLASSHSLSCTLKKLDNPSPFWETELDIGRWDDPVVGQVTVSISMGKR
jgi:hypothetical protein